MLLPPRFRAPIVLVKISYGTVLRDYYVSTSIKDIKFLTVEKKEEANLMV